MVGVAFIGTRTHALPDPARTRPLTHAHMNDWGRDCVTRSERMIHSTVDRNSYATPKNAMPLHRHTSGKCVLAWIRGRALIWIKQKDHEDNMTKKQLRHFPRRKNVATTSGASCCHCHRPHPPQTRRPSQPQPTVGTSADRPTACIKFLALMSPKHDERASASAARQGEILIQRYP